VPLCGIEERTVRIEAKEENWKEGTEREDINPGYRPLKN